jgi:hypothetical protein
LAAYPNKQEFKRAVRKIDRTLHELTSDDYPLKIHHDTIRWWGNGQLPQSFLKAQALFNEKLKDRIWYEKYKGKYAAVLIRGGKTLIETDSDPNTLMQKAYSMWGYRPIFMGYVTSDRNMISLRPQYTSTSICNSTKKITG